jgi:Mrp family chromosome partitioning ATPase
MDLLSYFRILRRRWWVVAVCVVVGIGLGWASTLIDSTGGDAHDAKAPRAYYKATHTFLPTRESDSVFPTTFDGLEQMAVLATTGPVPDAVAKELGGAENGPDLAKQITTVTDGDTHTLALTAIDPSPARAEQLAEAFSAQLVTNLTATDLERYQQASTDATDQLTALQGKIDALIAQIAATPPPPNVDLLQAQLRALEDQSADAYSAYQTLTSQRPPTSPLTTLQKARSVRISGDEYAAMLHDGEIGENNQQAGDDEDAAPEEASSSSGVSLDSTRSRLAVGAFLGLLAGIALALLLERLDRRIRTRADAEDALALPVLAEVPPASSKQQRERMVVTAAKPLSPIAEAYRAVRSSLLFERATLVGAPTGSSGLTAEVEPNGTGNVEANGSLEPNGNGSGSGSANGDGSDHDADARHDPLVVMVTSATPKDGKTTTSANLAAVFAEAGDSVLVVNCDFRRPMIHEYFDVPDEPRRVHQTAIPGVKVVTNVSHDPDPNPAQVIRMQRNVIAAAREKFDVLILDTAPLLSANDALEMVAEVDFVVFVARSGWTRFPAAQRAIDQLDRVDAPVVGTVLVGVGESENRYYAYYRPRPGASSTPHRRIEANGANGNGARRSDDLLLSDTKLEEFSGD